LLVRGLNLLQGEPFLAEKASDSMNELLAKLALEHNNGNLYKTRAFLAFRQNEALPLFSLPEELLERILIEVEESMTPKTTLPGLASVSLVSRKFHRIVEPLLYQQAMIHFNALGQTLQFKKILEDGSLSPQIAVPIPTTERCNANAYLRTIQARPDLVAHVKLLDLTRYDHGFQLRRTLGIYGYKEGSKSDFTLRDLERAVQTDTALPYEVWKSVETDALPLNRSMDPASETLGAILHTFVKAGNTKLRALDRTKYRTDSPWDPFLEEDAENPSTHQLLGHFTHLRSIRIHCRMMSLGAVWPLFTLPALRSIHIVGGSLTLTEYQIQRWKEIRASSVESITYELAESKWYVPDESNPLYYMSAACTDLQGVMIASILKVQSPGWYLGCLCPFAQHLDKFQRLSIRDRYSKSALPAATFTALHRDFICARISEIRRSKNLQILVIDAIYLLELISVSAIEGNKIPGVLKGATVTIKPTTYRVLFDLTLPPFLEILELSIGNECFLQDAVIDAFWALLPRLRERFPVLHQLNLGWHKANSYPAIQETLLTQALEKLGVKVKTECPLRLGG
jgi:hypothetical protein